MFIEKAAQMKPKLTSLSTLPDEQSALHVKRPSAGPGTNGVFQGALHRRQLLKGMLGAAAGLSPFLMAACSRHRPVVAPHYRPRHHTIAHEILEVELENRSQFELIENYVILDDLLDKVESVADDAGRRGVPREQAALDMLSGVDRMLRRCGYRYGRSGIISKGLKLRRINCDGSSAIYLAAGEILDMPIHLARAPFHAFVRWHFDKTDYLNWETTIGQVKEDRYYVKTHNIPDSAIGVSALRSLDVRRNRRNILANAYTNAGVQWLRSCEMEQARRRFGDAIQCDPLYDAPYFNMGLTSFKLGDNDEAVTWCSRAIRLNPNHTGAHAVMKIAYEELGNRNLAERHRKIVMRLDPEYYSPAANQGRRQNASICTFD